MPKKSTKTITKVKPKAKNVKSVRPDRAVAFADFCLWISLPTMLRGLDETNLIKFGIEDPKLLELCKIRNQNEFLKAYGMPEPATLSDWKAKIRREGIIDELSPVWAKGLTKNVLASLYNKILKDGKADAVKLWAQLVNGYKEKTIVDVNAYNDLEVWKKKLGITEENILSEGDESISSISEVDKSDL